MRNVATCRIVLLVFDNRPPVQIKVDNTERYDRLRARLTNYSENENPEPDPAFPLMSLEEVEKTFAISAAPPKTSFFRLRSAV